MALFDTLPKKMAATAFAFVAAYGLADVAFDNNIHPYQLHQQHMAEKATCNEMTDIELAEAQAEANEKIGTTVISSTNTIEILEKDDLPVYGFGKGVEGAQIIQFRCG